jgi:hypothetical protein
MGHSRRTQSINGSPKPDEASASTSLTLTARDGRPPLHTRPSMRHRMAKFDVPALYELLDIYSRRWQSEDSCAQWLDLIHLVRKLKLHERAVVLRVLQGFEYQEIGAWLEVTASRANQIGRAAIAHLRELEHSPAQAMPRPAPPARPPPHLSGEVLEAALVRARAADAERLRKTTPAPPKVACRYKPVVPQRLCRYARCPNPDVPVPNGRYHRACVREREADRRKRTLEVDRAVRRFFAPHTSPTPPEEPPPSARRGPRVSSKVSVQNMTKTYSYLEKLKQRRARRSTVDGSDRAVRHTEAGRRNRGLTTVVS